jgi:protein O-GlcNAc transferase
LKKCVAIAENSVMDAASNDLINKHLHAALAAEHVKRNDEALTHYESVLSIDPAHPGALLRVAQSLRAAQRSDEAIAMLQTAIRSARERGLASQSFPIHSALIVALRGSDAHARLAAARDAQRDCGEVPGLIWEECESLRALNMRQDRLVRLNRLAALQPNDRVILAELGLALMSSNSAPQAMQPMRAAIACGYRDNEFTLQLATIEIQNGEINAAIARVDEVLADDQKHFGALGLRWHIATQCCDWPTADALERTLLDRIAQGESHSALTPWRLLASHASPALLRDYTRAWSKRDSPPLKALRNSPAESHAPRRLRIGYLSSDFHQHATALLLAGVIATHDRNQFEMFAYSYGARVEDGYRSRLKSTFEHWRELNHLSDEAAAQLIARDALDVLIDLKGHTYGARRGIAAHRPAKIQAHYLGYPGTLALDGIDFFIADATTVPPEHEAHFNEQVVRVEGCYQANDNRRERPNALERASLALPEDAIVLCNFNQPWKWRRAFVEVWLGALSKHPTAYLWLLDPGQNHPAKANIDAAALRLSVSKQIVWAPNVAPEQHLARLAAADLALDQLPCNSHTTAADALWMGVPVLTCVGDRFDGRVAASLLRAAGADEWIAQDLEDYRRTLDRALSDATRLLRPREPNVDRFARTQLFNTDGFTRSWGKMLSDLVAQHASRAT